MQIVANAKSIGSLIRQERKLQKLTQEQLAGLTGLGARFVRELEAGKESCQLGRTLQVMAALGLRLTVQTRQDTAL
jgi:y4mF family transcriptional regulator